MAILQELNQREIGQVLLSAAERAVPVSITLRSGDTWSALSGRLTALRGEDLLLQLAPDQPADAPPLTTGLGIGISLKLKHHKYLFVAGVLEQWQEGSERLLVVSHPSRMQRLQRRAFLRAAVPPGWVVRAAFWIGGVKNEPPGATPERPVWNGRLIDLSAGGFSLRTIDPTVGVLEIGDLMGVRIVFGVGEQAVYADVSLRHVDLEQGGAVVGFQFLGLEHSDVGKDALRIISRKVADYQAAAPPTRDSDVDAAEGAAPAGQLDRRGEGT